MSKSDGLIAALDLVQNKIEKMFTEVKSLKEVQKITGSNNLKDIYRASVCIAPMLSLEKELMIVIENEKINEMEEAANPDKGL